MGEGGEYFVYGVLIKGHAHCSQARKDKCEN